LIYILLEVHITFIKECWKCIGFNKT